MSSTANSVGARAVENIMHGYSNLAALEKTPPVVISGGRGVHVIDEDGKEYIEVARNTPHWNSRVYCFLLI